MNQESARVSATVVEVETVQAYYCDNVAIPMLGRHHKGRNERHARNALKERQEVVETKGRGGLENGLSITTATPLDGLSSPPKAPRMIR